MWDTAAGMIKRLVAGSSNLTITTDSSGNVVLDAGGTSSGIPASVAEFTSSAIPLKQPTAVAATFAAHEVKSNYYVANGNNEVTLLGTTEGSIACAADALGLTVIRARNRSSTQGVWSPRTRQMLTSASRTRPHHATSGFQEP